MALERELRADSVGPRRMRDSMMVGRPMGRTTNTGERLITIPVPTQGEIILRYGLPIRDPAVSSTGRDTVVMVPPTGDVAASLADIERRLTARLDAIERAQMAAPRTPPAPGVTVVTPGAMPEAVSRDNTPVFQRFSQIGTRDLQPYAGIGIRDGDAQLIVGARADLGPVRVGSGVRFVPELAVGVGSGALSVLAMANARYAFGSVNGTGAFRPYVTLGAGVYTPTVLGINTAVGSSIRLREETDRPLFLNVELQGLNLFGETRVLVGLSRSR
jgi:hypothetical protein